MKQSILIALAAGLCFLFIGYTYLENELQKTTIIHDSEHIAFQKNLHNLIGSKLRRDAEIHFNLYVLQPEVINILKDAATSSTANRQALMQELQKMVEPVYAHLKPSGIQDFYLNDAQSSPLVQIQDDLLQDEQSITNRPELLRISMEKKPVTCFKTSKRGMTLHNIFPIFLNNDYIGHAGFVFSHDYILRQLKDMSKGLIENLDYGIILKKAALLDAHSQIPLQNYRESPYLTDWLMPLNHFESSTASITTLNDLLHSAVSGGYLNELQRRLTNLESFTIHLPFNDGTAFLIFTPILGAQDSLQAYLIAFSSRDIEYMTLQSDHRNRLLLLYGISLFFSVLVYLVFFSYQKQRKTTTFLSTLVRNMPDGLLVIDSHENIQEANETACQMLGYSKEELMGQNPHHLLHYHEGSSVNQQDCPVYKAILETGGYLGETEFKRKNGDIFPVSLSCNVFLQRNKDQKNTVMVFRDISSQNATRRELQENAGFYAMLMDITTLFLTTDHKRMDETIIYAIGQIARFFEADRCYLCHFSEDYEFLTSTYSWHREGLEPTWVSCLEAVKKCGWFVDKLFRQQTVYVSNINELPANAYCERDSMIKGQINALVLIPVMDNAVTTGCYAFEYRTPQRFKEETVSRMIFATDIITNALYKFRFERQLVEMATTDGLTGLFNRRHFIELAEKEIQLVLRYNTPLSLIMFDIDHFKQINDSFGHAIGDDVLRELAARVRQCLRETDFAGRLGGEEFGIICRAEPQNARILAERLRKAMADKPVVCGETEIPFTISLGIAGLQDGAQDITELLKRADDALYKAKNTGRNQTKIWESADYTDQPLQLK